MIDYINKIIEDVFIHLETIEMEEETSLRKAKKAILMLKEIIQQLKIKLSDYKFANEEEEIHFFKELKPQLSSKLVYYSEIYKFETKRPIGSDITQKEYILDELDKIKDYFVKNLEFYQYYRAERIHLDQYYFLRREPDFEFNVDYFYFERDNNFSSCNDFKVAKILANELLRIYLNTELHKLEKRNGDDRTTSKIPPVKQTWTGTKTELVELIYALHTSGSINFGNVDIKELFDYYCIVFNTDAGDYYRTYLNIRNRKDRTLFLDTLREKLIKKMDSDDQ